MAVPLEKKTSKDPVVRAGGALVGDAEKRFRLDFDGVARLVSALKREDPLSDELRQQLLELLHHLLGELLADSLKSQRGRRSWLSPTKAAALRVLKILRDDPGATKKKAIRDIVENEKDFEAVRKQIDRLNKRKFTVTYEKGHK